MSGASSSGKTTCTSSQTPRRTSWLVSSLFEVKWSQTFDDSTRDMLKLQGEIAQSVARELQLVLSPDELAKVTKRATENPEAYQEYLQGRIEWKKRSRQGFAN